MFLHRFSWKIFLRVICFCTTYFNFILLYRYSGEIIKNLVRKSFMPNNSIDKIYTSLVHYWPIVGLSLVHRWLTVALPLQHQTCVFGLQNSFPLALERMLILIFPIVVDDYHKNNVSDLLRSEKLHGFICLTYTPVDLFCLCLSFFFCCSFKISTDTRPSSWTSYS